MRPKVKGVPVNVPAPEGAITLAEAAWYAARTNQRLTCKVVRGDMGKASSDGQRLLIAANDRLLVASYIISGHVSVQPPMTTDWTFVTPQDAERIIVEVEAAP